MANVDRLHRTATLSERAADQIRAMITSGKWPVGTRIPAEHELVERFDVSRNTVREALRALVHTGLLEARVGDGTYVMATSELRAAVLRRTETSTTDEVLALRLLLEEYAAGLAAVNAGSEDVRRLRALLEDVPAAASRSIADHAEADIAFHREIVRLSGNSLLVDLYDHLGAALSDLLSSLMSSRPTADEHDRLHMELVEAIAARDEVAARHIASLLVSEARRMHSEASGDREQKL
ncbi:FadR/GntR family transcriptional regulator [Rhodococcus sp. MEB064]|uniref:FadR/GntR family transcriptional regulator n=1 Tax=Rhodococcus sp. MEB064 TaxID=1587522 RepID=UPI0005ACFB87|nr:FadR/GntR family transcriptional regulator [Rhodococcus sp. MEB064]KIQ17469.1 hypothetical protein RU01_09770 [Rhodococcus sp. MEB064]